MGIWPDKELKNKSWDTFFFPLKLNLSFHFPPTWAVLFFFFFLAINGNVLFLANAWSYLCPLLAFCRNTGTSCGSSITSVIQIHQTERRVPTDNVQPVVGTCSWDGSSKPCVKAQHFPSTSVVHSYKLTWKARKHLLTPQRSWVAFNLGHWQLVEMLYDPETEREALRFHWNQLNQLVFLLGRGECLILTAVQAFVLKLPDISFDTAVSSYSLTLPVILLLRFVSEAAVTRTSHSPTSK